MDKISERLGAQTGISPPEELVVIAQEFDNISTDLRKKVREFASDDYQYARGKMKNAIEQCASLMPGIVALADAAESPLVYSSAANLFKVFVDMNQSLVDVSTKLDRISSNVGKDETIEKPADVGNPNQDGAFFEGTTADLLSRVLKEVKARKAQEEVIDI